MIQRVQSIYLFAAAVLTAISAFLPLAYFTISSGEVFDLYAAGLRDAGGEVLQGSTYLFVLAIIATITPLVSILLFKRRMLQLRICVVGSVLTVGYYLMMGAYFFLSCRVFEDAGVVSRGFHPALFAPAIAIVLSLMAAKRVFADELLVRSVDRIR